MNFENALVAMRKGFKVIRKKSLSRLNGVYYTLENGVLYTTPCCDCGFRRKKEVVVSLSGSSILADDWTVYK